MVAFAPSTCQFHPRVPVTTSFFFFDSLHASLVGLQTHRRLPLFVCYAHSLSTPLKKLRHFRLNSVHRESPTPRQSMPVAPVQRVEGGGSRDCFTSKAPDWMEKWKRGGFWSLRKRPQAAVDYRQGLSSDDDEVGTSRSTGSSTMERIVEKLKKFGYIDDAPGSTEGRLPEKGSVEDIFYAEDGILPDTRGGLSWDLTQDEEVRFPWEKTEGEREAAAGGSARRKPSRTSLAELTLPEGELRRLRHLAIRTKSKIRIGGAGVTSEIVEKIHEKWQTEEVVRLKCEGPPALNMRRMHEILERKTGGLVIWRSGSSLSLYRGIGYKLSQPEKTHMQSTRMTRFTSFDKGHKASDEPIGSPLEKDEHRNVEFLPDGSVSSTEKKKDSKSFREINYEDEVDKLLDGLGPRYTDWPGSNPLPVDADLLPGVVRGYRPPFRVLPYGVRPALGIKETTALRRLARVLPPHFALGRSRQHQGLAMAMVKLWEKSSIAKIALKRGVQLTTSERMAVDIKKLTGGSLLSRNKDYIVFYRGKDFLSPEVAEALMERERLAKSLQDEEEQARLHASSVVSNIEAIEEPGGAGTLGETLEADAKWGKKLDDHHKNKMMKAAEVARHAQLVKKLERKLFQAEFKLRKAEKALFKVEEFLKPVGPRIDPESITDEERFMFRKLGLRMKAFLLLGRRGVFDGTVENMHLHWKYRELVKIIVKSKNFAEVRNVALSLEAESGGVLVSVDKISKGFAIVVYRGKDYRRPQYLRPKNLLTKRKALARSIELQRQEAIHRHISHIQKRVEQLRSELAQMETVKDRGDEDLYSRLDAAYMTEDDNAEDEGDEAYLETFDSPADDENDGVDVESENYDRSAEEQSIGSFNSVLDEYCNRLNETSEPDAETSANL
ncbi:hypothetical protein Taro_011132 [Colocasia esculenta]|uniref:CRM-domain containing factor CFM3, chloroplastic/mitochondrial n=1 Tax=Colocasia esculenta TaxID=4460 RepID=A0A843U9C5_COLES|nr:hypothetical protein [Colocasia esculenta]